MFGGADGRIPATFQVLYLTGWRPHDSQQQPARRGQRHRRPNAGSQSARTIGPITSLDRLGRYNACAQQAGGLSGQVEQGGAEAVSGPAAVNRSARPCDPRPAATSCGGERARRARGIGARRRQRPRGGFDDGARGVVAGNPQRDSGRALMSQRREGGARRARQHQGQRAGPELLRKRQGRRGEVGAGLRPSPSSATRAMSGLSAGLPLARKTPATAASEVASGGEPVDRVGRQPDEPTVSDHPCGLRDGIGGGREAGRDRVMESGGVIGLLIHAAGDEGRIDEPRLAIAQLIDRSGRGHGRLRRRGLRGRRRCPTPWCGRSGGICRLHPAPEGRT